MHSIQQLQDQSLSLSVLPAAVVRTQGQWRMMISVLYKRGAAGALHAGLCGTYSTDFPGLAKKDSCLVQEYTRFTGSPFSLPSGLSLSYKNSRPLFSLPSGMRKSPDVSPRRLSDISPQLRQLKYLVVDEAIKEDLKSSRSVEDINSASIEERILRITGYYGYQPWSASYNSEFPYMQLQLDGVLWLTWLTCFMWVDGARGLGTLARITACESIMCVNKH